MDETRSGAAGRILIVDDDPDVVDYLQAFFEDNRFEVRAANNTREGMVRAKAFRPQLITLDISMPQESGVKMLGELKQETELGRIPVLIVTGMPDEVRGVIEGNPDLVQPKAYIQKPIDRPQLLELIERLI